MSTIPELESSDRFLVQQVFKPIANEYRISVPTPGSKDEGRPVLFVKQKKLKIREDIRFRTSQDDTAPHVFMIKARTVFEFRGRHDVLDAEDNPIGALEKVFGLSLLRSHWRVKDPSGPSCSRRTSRAGRSRSSVGSPTSGPTGSRCSSGCRSTSR